MKFKNFWLMALTIVFATYVSLKANTLFTGNPAAIATNTFSVAILASEIDQCTGDFYVGLNTLAGAEGGFVISRLPFGETAFTPLALDPLVLSTTTRCLHLPYGLNKAVPFVAVIQDATAIDRRATVLATDGTTVNQSEILHDAAGADNGGTSAATVIINPCTAASENHIFTMVRPIAATALGTADTGMSVTRVTPGSLALDTVNATTGASAGNVAFRLDAVAGSPILTGVNATGDPFFFAGVPTATELWLAGAVSPNLYWDERLQRLYMGSIFASNAGGDSFKTIAAFRISNSDILSVDPMVPDAAITGAVATAPGHLLGIVAAGGAEQAGAFGVNVMHTSTGLPYIIFNGGLRPAGDSAEDKVWALPLINDPAATLALSGTVSNNVLNAGGFFDVAATAGSIDAGGDAAVLRRARVGAGSLPILRTASTLVQALEVIGDTVFAAFAGALAAGNVDGGNQPGVFSSTAQFDLEGKIISWTPWQRVEPQVLFTGTAGVVSGFGQAKRIDVNPVTGKVVVVEGEDAVTVKRADWNTGAVATDLATTVNAQVSDGCFSALDLNSTTRGLGTPDGARTDIPGRYTLFGGDGKVVIVRTGVSTAPAHVTQVISTDYSLATNFRVDTLPGTPGPVHVLEYSRRVAGEGAQNYFFAGTPTGLFAFAATAGGGGFTAGAAINVLNAGPFTTSSWQKVGVGVQGLDSNFIVDIKTQGQILYCITCERRTDMPPRFHLLRIPFAATIGAMFAATNILTVADSTESQFVDIVSFNGMQIFATGATATPDTKEQLCLATDNGLFHSRADQAGAATGSIGAANSAGMAWTRYPGSKGTVFTGIASANTPRHHTVWPIGIDDDALGTFERGRVYQTSGHGNAAGTAAQFTPDATAPSNTSLGSFNPGSLNAEFAYNPSLESIPLIKNFCSPDARRFFTTMAKPNLGIKDQLQASPFQNGPFCSAAPNLISDDPALINRQFFGCATSGHLGELCILTDQGIVVLS